jgi:hypothetical protein
VASVFVALMEPLSLFSDCTAITSSNSTTTIVLLPLRKPAIAVLGIFPLKCWYVMLQYWIEDRAAVK